MRTACTTVHTCPRKINKNGFLFLHCTRPDYITLLLMKEANSAITLDPIKLADNVDAEEVVLVDAGAGDPGDGDIGASGAQGNIFTVQ